MKKTNITPEDILRDHSPSVVKLVSELRRIARITLPEVTEKAYPGWHAIGYRHPEAGYICGIFPFEEEVKVYFENGKFLPDPDNLLEGNTKQTRYYALSVGDKIRAIPFKNLLLASTKFDKREIILAK